MRGIASGLGLNGPTSRRRPQLEPAPGPMAQLLDEMVNAVEATQRYYNTAQQLRTRPSTFKRVHTESLAELLRELRGLQTQRNKNDDFISPTSAAAQTLLRGLLLIAAYRGHMQKRHSKRLIRQLDGTLQKITVHTTDKAQHEDPDLPASFNFIALLNQLGIPTTLEAIDKERVVEIDSGPLGALAFRMFRNLRNYRRGHYLRGWAKGGRKARHQFPNLASCSLFINDAGVDNPFLDDNSDAKRLEREYASAQTRLAVFFIKVEAVSETQHSEYEPSMQGRLLGETAGRSLVMTEFRTG